jgi:hypothetical protein
LVNVAVENLENFGDAHCWLFANDK